MAGVKGRSGKKVGTVSAAPEKDYIECAEHKPYRDSDGDVVCRLCHILLKVGPLGMSGTSFEGRQSE
jgi:hypothetical protein